jgi:hypothetical protein
MNTKFSNTKAILIEMIQDPKSSYPTTTYKYNIRSFV